MKIAVSSQDKAHVTGHLGRCQRFWVYDLEGDDIQGKELFQLTKDQSFHESSPQAAHPLDGVQVLISGGMGRGLARRLESRGILPVITPETDPDVAIAAYTAGTLAITALEDHVHHHDHDHDHGHQHGHQHDHGEGEGCGCSSAS
ncbi:MAG: NifB/NifX family molybdenum-iron cluster-binding protein [Spirulina sp.]